MPYLIAARRSKTMGIAPLIASGFTTKNNIILERLPIGDGGISRGTPIFQQPLPVNGGSASPLPTPTPAPLPIIVPAANAGTPVPAGYPTSQIFVDPNGAFWEYSASQNQWMNVGTPYNTGATAIPPAVPTGSTPSAPTSLLSPTTAPAPVSTVNIAAPSSTYQDLLNWLQEDTLGATIGFSSIPNWIIVAGAGALAWKFSQHGGKR